MARKKQEARLVHERAWVVSRVTYKHDPDWGAGAADINAVLVSLHVIEVCLAASLAEGRAGREMALVACAEYDLLIDTANLKAWKERGRDRGFVMHEGAVM